MRETKRQERWSRVAAERSTISPLADAVSHGLQSTERSAVECLASGAARNVLRVAFHKLVDRGGSTLVSEVDLHHVGWGLGRTRPYHSKTNRKRTTNKKRKRAGANF